MKKLLLIGVYLSVTQIYAQESVLSSGGNSSGANGSVSYSVGQLFYKTVNGGNANLSPGAEQPFEIQTVLGLDNFNISLELSVYPNPTTDKIYLKVKESSFESLQYRLFDMNGRLLESNKIYDSLTIVQMDNYPEAIYLFKVIDKEKEVKTFKIIKNKQLSK
ncbi:MULTISPECIES: T9SS type A sorting domain-containing protein [Flavobacterium]|uniref:Secretion system C-terminal sorting domain-containing protein n=1 Tax=Flavobacterium hankyongi TaxID=1176532 RepID=A0ABP8ZI82_9FLAO|nr:T9SS type A sorting domain-containing protein [Flavobacterium sp. N1846]